MRRRRFFDASSPFQWAALAMFFGIFFVAMQLVTVVPHPGAAREKLIADLLFGGPTLFFIAMAFRAAHRRSALIQRLRLGQCANCGYDLRGSVDRCPECGTAFQRRST